MVYALLTIILIIGLGTVVVFCAQLMSARTGAPAISSSRKRIQSMLGLARLTPKDTMIDLGSGTGRVLATAARSGCQCVGYEINPLLALYSRLRLKRYTNVRVLNRSFFDAPLADATVIFIYLMPAVLKRLQAKFLVLPEKTKIISNGFPLPGWKPMAVRDNVYLYKGGARGTDKI